MLTRRLFLLASGLPFLPKFGSVKKEKLKQNNYIDPNRVYKMIKFTIICTHDYINRFRVETGKYGKVEINGGEIDIVYDPTNDFLNEPVVDLVGRKGTALLMDGRWCIISLCCSDDDIQLYQQRCFERGVFPSFANYKKINYDWIT